MVGLAPIQEMILAIGVPVPLLLIPDVVKQSHK
jgi:hypothetical protein